MVRGGDRRSNNGRAAWNGSWGAHTITAINIKLIIIGEFANGAQEEIDGGALFGRTFINRVFD